MDILDQTFTPQVRLHYLRNTPGVPVGHTFIIYARHLSYGGHWTSQYLGEYNSSGCQTDGPHVHTWFSGLVPGTINIIARDLYFNCPGQGWQPGFNFPCGNFAPWPWTLPNDLTDWIYVTQWDTPY